MESLFEELGISKKFIKTTTQDNRFIVLVHRTWLKSLLKDYKLLSDVQEKPRIEQWTFDNEEPGQSWTKIFVSVYKKRDCKVIPLPRVKVNSRPETPFLFAQLMEYVSQTNYKNLWKESYKKYSAKSENGKETPVVLADYNEVLREVITRTYGCLFVNTCRPEANSEPSKQFDGHPNFVQCVCAVETLNAFFLLHSPFVEHNLNDCVTFSQAILDSCYTKPLFIVYQLLHVMKTMHDRSLTLGDIRLHDVYLTKDLWVMVFPQITSNIHVVEVSESNKVVKDVEHYKNRYKKDVFGINSKSNLKTTESLEKLCERWVNGQLSNFDYLMALNNLSNRKYGDPNCHPVFPWVTDFSSRCGKAWRDLRKSKYRLNKGDRQLDLTYNHPPNAQIPPHHVSAVLSSITYYVYMARRTPKSVLCRNVRPVWVPAEYPASIQRLQEWSPDECIPEFYSDASVFRSVHEDLDDLEVPAWCGGDVEGFVQRHREALESEHVSERLHGWIDLTFGYKLSGNAAIKAKNVCLNLVDGHSNLTCSGIVQLFTHPHPARVSFSPFWGKIPPKIYYQKEHKEHKEHKSKTRDNSSSSTAIETSRSEEEVDEDNSSSSQRSPLVLSRLLSRSRSSLNDTTSDSSKEHSSNSSSQQQKLSRSPSATRSLSLGPRNATFTSHTRSSRSSNPLNTGHIQTLPRDYNPAQALSQLEAKHAFFSRTFHTDVGSKSSTQPSEDPKTSDTKQVKVVGGDLILGTTETAEDEDNGGQNAFTNRFFSENFEARMWQPYGSGGGAGVNRSGASKSFTFPVDGSSSDVYRYGNSGVTRGRSRNIPVEVVAPSAPSVVCNYAEIITTRRTKELQILGCLILEIFMTKHLRALGTNNSSARTTPFSTRLQAALTILHSQCHEVPSCVQTVLALLLQQPAEHTSSSQYMPVSHLGLPPPSAHLLLEPLLHASVVPFPRHFYQLYGLLRRLKEFALVGEEVRLLYHFDCDGTRCSDFESVERERVVLEQSVGECQVKRCAGDMELLLEDFNTNTDGGVAELLVVYIRDVIEWAPSSVLALWYLFDPIARLLGPKRTAETLLEPILKLYENDLSEITIPYSAKIAKIYHHSFLLRLIVRLGLRCFLEHFITPLVEAVGGYRDCEKMDFVLHTHTNQNEGATAGNSTVSSRKSSHHLRMISTATEEQELSPSDESSNSDKQLGADIKSPPKKKSPKVSVDKPDDTLLNKSEPEMFEFECESSTGERSASANGEPMKSLLEHLELNIAGDLPFNHSTAEEALDATVLADDQDPIRTLEALDLDLTDTTINSCSVGLMSPTIPIPPSSYRHSGSVSNNVTDITCDYGSRKSDDIPAVLLLLGKQSSDVTTETEAETEESRTRRSRSFSSRQRTKAKISDMSADSVGWLSHRLGPVLTARYLSRNLLKMLTLCYVGRENLIMSARSLDESVDGCVEVSVACSRVVGDKNAAKVLECLANIAALYGEQLILLQYLPHMSELIALCKRKLTLNLEGGLISCLALLQHIIPYVSDSTLMDQLQDVILKNILHPCIRLLGSTKYSFPNGSIARNVLARKYLDTLYVLSLRMGADNTKTHLAVPALQRFFLIFDKVNNDSGYYGQATDTKTEPQPKENLLKSMEESHFVELRRDGTTKEWAIGGRPIQISHVRLKDTDSTDSLSPPTVPNNVAGSFEDSVFNQAIEELQSVFTSSLAHTAYVPFLKQIGLVALQQSLKNHTTIHNLCREHEAELTNTNTVTSHITIPTNTTTTTNTTLLSTSSNNNNNTVTVIGNRIEVQPAMGTSVTSQQEEGKDGGVDDVLLRLISDKMENSSRHLRGNWLAYWEHEIGRAEKDSRFNFKQIKLQTFAGHTTSVRCLSVLDNENSFMSGSRDKTVKLWSLRSQGDGTTINACQWTYSGHRKSVLSLAFVDSLRLVASCDGTVHLWDPFLGNVIGQLEASAKFGPVNVLRGYPAPSSQLVAATTDGSLRVVDVRLCAYVQDLKVTVNPMGLIRCLAVSPLGHYVATGQYSGQVTILDTRTGLVVGSWRAHEGEVLQVAFVQESCLITTSLDQTVAVWGVHDGKLKFYMKGPSEPVHCLNIYNEELVTATTANKIGVHSAIAADAAFSNTKLRSDTFRGLLTSTTVLPLNRLLLLGADTGVITLLC